MHSSYENCVAPPFIVELLVFQVIEIKCVRLGVLLVAKFNLLCLEMLIRTGCDLFLGLQLFLSRKPETFFENPRFATNLI